MTRMIQTAAMVRGVVSVPFLVPVVQRTLPHACHWQHHLGPCGRNYTGESLRRPAWPASEVNRRYCDTFLEVGVGRAHPVHVVERRDMLLAAVVASCRDLLPSVGLQQGVRNHAATGPRRCGRRGLFFRASCAACTAAAGKGIPAAMGLSRRFRPWKIAHSWDRSTRRSS